MGKADVVSVPEGLRSDLDKIAKLLRGENGGALWDVLTAMRGPDSPSERPNMPPDQAARAYKGRRDRKYKTGEILRAVALPGATPGARTHLDTKVTLPPQDTWDHYDKHVARAAKALGLGIEVEAPRKIEGEIKITVTSQAKKLEDKVKEVLGGMFDTATFVNKADDGENSTIKLAVPDDVTKASTIQTQLNHLGVMVEWTDNPNLPPVPEWKIELVQNYHGINAAHAKTLLLTKAVWMSTIKNKFALGEYMEKLGVPVDLKLIHNALINSIGLAGAKKYVEQAVKS